MTEQQSEYNDRVVGAQTGAVDQLLDALQEYVDALREQRKGDARHWRAVIRRSMATWLELLINQFDSRDASTLVMVLRELDALRTEIHSPSVIVHPPDAADERDHGHDETGSPL